MNLRADRLRLRASAACVALAVAFVAWAPMRAHANRGLLYGPEDAIPFGPTDANGLVGYCIPWSILTAMHLGAGTTLRASDGVGRRPYVDLTMAIRCGRSLNADPGYSGYVFMPQLGYSYDADRGSGVGGPSHLGRLGLGFGIGSSRATVLYVPRFLFGNRDDVRARGLRHGLVASFGSDLVTIEIAHQMLVVGTRPEHDLRVGMSLNLAIVAYVLAH